MQSSCNIESKLFIEIMENKVMDSLQEMQNYEVMYSLGVISRLEMIKNIRGVTLEEAKTIMDEIDRELEEQPKPQVNGGDENDENESKQNNQSI